MTRLRPPLDAAKTGWSRRHWLQAGVGAAAAPLLAGCGSPLPLVAPPTATPADQAAAARLMESARAHGWDAYRALTDINISYDGQWRPLIDRIQPVVVDKTFRGASQERLMPAAGAVAQHYTGSAGHKQVSWRRGKGQPDHLGEVAVWFNGRRSSNPAVLAASALVAEAYALFLLGPLWLVERGLAVQAGGRQRINGRLCDVVQVVLRPGLGQVTMDRVAVFIDRDDATTRRVRFTLEGYEGTRGAVAETDTFEHQRRFGVLWPMRSYEEVVHPLRLPAHDWYVTGLDVNRGYTVQDLAGAQFTGAAAGAAGAL